MNALQKWLNDLADEFDQGIRPLSSTLAAKAKRLREAADVLSHQSSAQPVGHQKPVVFRTLMLTGKWSDWMPYGPWLPNEDVKTEYAYAAPASGQKVPDGWKLVPERYLTEEMAKAGLEYIRKARKKTGCILVGDFWDAIIAAAPEPPSESEGRPIHSASLGPRTDAHGGEIEG